MSGRRLVVGFGIFVLVFAAALYWAQVFAFYERHAGPGALRIGGEPVPVVLADSIDATSSPLKLRGCLEIDPAVVAGLAPVDDATPLTAPFWFRCFDVRSLTVDLASGAARAYRIEPDTPQGFDLMLAVYPDGRGFIWRQLNKRFSG